MPCVYNDVLFLQIEIIQIIISNKLHMTSYIRDIFAAQILSASDLLQNEFQFIRIKFQSIRFEFCSIRIEYHSVKTEVHFRWIHGDWVWASFEIQNSTPITWHNYAAYHSLIQSLPITLSNVGCSPAKRYWKLNFLRVGYQHIH